MKPKIGLLICMLLYSELVISENYIDILRRAPVNHFQLLLNNMNMFFLAKMEDLVKEENNEKEPEQVFIKFLESEKGGLMVASLYRAPVPMVTRSKCNKLIDEAYANFRGADSKFTEIINIISYYRMSKKEAMDIINSIKFKVSIQAKENIELSVSCSR